MALSKESLKEKGYKSIETDRGNAIFRLIFKEFISQEEIQEKLQEKYRKEKGKKIDSQVLSNLTSNYLNAWKEMNYLKISRVGNPKTKSKYHPNTNVYFAELTPLFDYCKEPFTEEEKEVLNSVLFPKRELILKEFPEENIIQAVLKYYVKHFIVKEYYVLKKLEQSPKAIKEYIKKSNEQSNKKYSSYENIKEELDKKILTALNLLPSI